MPDGIRRRARAEPARPVEGVHPVLARVFANRGVVDAGEISLELDRLLPPDGLAGIGAAADLLADCVERDRKVLVVGDFDADGATGSALAVSLLRELGLNSVDFLVPNRFDYGYGLTPELVRLAARQRPDLIVTVDNGISSREGVALAASLGIRTLVTDHHLPGAALPPADVIVNPNQPGCGFASKHLAGVGVIFYVMLALRAALRERGWFERRGAREPNLASVLDLVALGTVADVVPLDRNNRVLVQQGLLRIRAGRCRPGIRALLEVAGRDPSRLVAGDLAFAAAPRLNAAGRLDDMSAGIACLLAEDDAEARGLAAELDALNRDRRRIERDMQRDAMEILAGIGIATERQSQPPPVLCLYEPDWHQGVVGILASRIKERMHRPVVAFARAGHGLLKGSARSIPGLHIRDALERVHGLQPDLIDRFGGHAMAAGLSLAETDLDRFRHALTRAVREMLAGVELEPVLETDGELGGEDLDLELARELRYAGPWGQRFPEPVFDGVFHVVHQRLVGERHLKLVLRHPDEPDFPLDAIAFDIDPDVWPDRDVDRVLLAYRLDCNYFRGEERLQLAIEYIEPA